jgi:hypothetical protein
VNSTFDAPFQESLLGSTALIPKDQRSASQLADFISSATAILRPDFCNNNDDTEPTIASR